MKYKYNQGSTNLPKLTWIKVQVNTILDKISGFCHGAVEVLNLLGCYTAQIGNWLPMFQDRPISPIIKDQAVLVTSSQVMLHNISEEQRPQFFRLDSVNKCYEHTEGH
jgi:hypothetical protein